VDGRITDRQRRLSTPTTMAWIAGGPRIMGGEARARRETHRRTDQIGAWNRDQSRKPAASSASIRTRATVSSAAVDPAFMVRGSGDGDEAGVKWTWRRFAVGTTSWSASLRRRPSLIDFPLHEVKRLARSEPLVVEIKRILGHLGFMVAGRRPGGEGRGASWRTTLHGKADIGRGKSCRIVGVARCR